MATTEPPRHDAQRTPAPQAPADPEVPGRASRERPGVLTHATGPDVLVERAGRPARSATKPGARAGRPVVSRPPEPIAAEPSAPERPPASSGSLTGQRAAPAHPPVTIGEIHVHVAEPPSAAADPLALLAPYAGGLTARRDGAW